MKLPDINKHIEKLISSTENIILSPYFPIIIAGLIIFGLILFGMIK